MTDLYFEDYEPGRKRARGWECLGSVVILCAVIIGFTLFFMFYAFIWAHIVDSLVQHVFELTTLGVIIVFLIIVYVWRNRNLERRKLMAAS